MQWLLHLPKTRERIARPVVQYDITGPNRGFKPSTGQTPSKGIGYILTAEDRCARPRLCTRRQRVRCGSARPFQFEEFY